MFIKILQEDRHEYIAALEYIEKLPIKKVLFFYIIFVMIRNRRYKTSMNIYALMQCKNILNNTFF